MGFLRLACTCEETCQCVWPPNASLYASSTCAHLRLLAGPFDQGLTEEDVASPSFFPLKTDLVQNSKRVVEQGDSSRAR